MADGSLPPGPRLPAVIQTALLYRDPVRFLDSCARRHGPVFRVRLAGLPRYVYVATPELARQVYAADRTVARAGEGRHDFMAPLVGEQSLLVTEDEQWLRQRKLLGPVFHRKHVDGYAEEIAAIAAAEVDRWPLGRPIDLRPLMQKITLEVILRLVFGVTEAHRLERFREHLPRLLDTTGSLMLWLLPTGAWKRKRSRRLLGRLPNPLQTFMRARERVDELLFEEIGRRRRELDDSRRDVLSMLLRARDDEGRVMADVELRDELVTLLEAGHETTATGLAWAFERLLRNRDALERLVAEVDAGESEYLDAVVRETLRTRSVVLDTPRLLSGPLELGGYVVPAGWYVAPAIPSVQRDPSIGPQPDEFRPERFLTAAPREGWIPFGGGKRHCVGSHLALLEMRVVIAEVVRRLDLETVERAPERQRVHHVTLVPSKGARVVARARATTASAIAAPTRAPAARREALDW